MGCFYPTRACRWEYWKLWAEMPLFTETGLGITLALLGQLCYAPILYHCLLKAASRIVQRYGFVIYGVQALLIVMHGLMSEAASGTAGLLWNLDREKNIPTTFSAALLSLTGCISLYIALQYARMPVRQRLYWCGIGIGYFVLALDEFFVWHEGSKILRAAYLWCGLAFALIIICWIWKTDGKLRRGLFGLLLGIFISAIGAFLLELPRDNRRCVNGFGLLPITCFEGITIEETMENLGTLTSSLGLLIAAEYYAASDYRSSKAKSMSTMR